MDPEEYQDIKELWFPKIRAAMFKHEFLVNLKLCPVPGEHNLKVLSSTAGVSSECYASQWLMFLSPISAKASLVVWRIIVKNMSHKGYISIPIRFQSINFVLYLGLTTDVTNFTKVTNQKRGIFIIPFLEHETIDTVYSLSPETCFGRYTWPTCFLKVYYVLGNSRVLTSSLSGKFRGVFNSKNAYWTSALSKNRDTKGMRFPE